MFLFVAKLETLRDLILEARKKLRVTNRAIGQAVGVTDQAISDYIRGMYPTPNWASNWEKLVPVLKVSTDRLQAAVENTFSAADAFNNVPIVGGSVPMRRLPVFRFTPANRLGGPADFYGSDFSETVHEDQETIEAPAPSKRCIVIVLDGDCMEPKYQHGSKVIIDFDAVNNASGLIPGAAYFIQLRGEGEGKNTFKEFVEFKNGEAVFRCINPKYRAKMKIKPPFNAGLAVARMD